MQRVLDLATEQHTTAGGELGAILDLAFTLDAGHAAAVAITDRIESGNITQDRMGLSLEGLLAMRSRLTFGDRRTLTRVAEGLRGLPNLRQAFHAGEVGWAQVRQIISEARPLTVDARLALDARFADLEAVGRMDPDQLVDVVRDDVARLRPDLATDRAVRSIESRFLHLQPAFDGALTGYFELDPEAGTTFLEGLEAVTEAPTADDTVPKDPSDPVTPADRADLSDLGPDAVEHAAHQPAFADSVVRRSRARQRADGLVQLAEAALAGSCDEGGGPKRARVRMNIVADVNTLTGNDEAGRAARLLWQTVAPPPALTPGAVRRLASDADLRFVLMDRGEVLGVTAPTPTIPTKVRVAAHTRDQGCRFPGCRVPPAWTDLHHVVPRIENGPTTIDNLVALCRRHHVLVTQGRWRLTMTSDGVVTVRRGRHVAVSDPPLEQQRPPDAPPAPGREPPELTSGPGRHPPGRGSGAASTTRGAQTTPARLVPI